jgi:hypothetical protein
MMMMMMIRNQENPPVASNKIRRSEKTHPTFQILVFYQKQVLENKHIVLYSNIKNSADKKVSQSRPDISLSRTAWSRVLEKLMVNQPFKKLPASYGTRRFISVFAKSRHQALS